MIPSVVIRLVAPAILLVTASCGVGPDAGNTDTPRKTESGAPEAPPAPAGPASATARQGQVTRIPLGTLFQYQQEGRALIFDVRPAFIHRLGHIPGAISWPRSDFESRLARNEPLIDAARTQGKPVVLYCVDLACPDARAVAAELARRGHPVSVLEGGFDAWKTGGLPTE